MTLLTLLKATTGGGGVAVSFLDATTTGNTAFASSRAVPVPTGGGALQADDVVVVRLSRWESSNPAVTTPAGTWVHRTQAVNGSGKIDTYLKRLTASDSGTYTFSWTGSMWTTGQAVAYRGVDPAVDLSTIPLHQVTNSGTAWPAATLNSVSAGVLDWHGYSESGGTHTVPTTPAFTEVEDNDSDVHGYFIATAGSYTTSGGASSVSSPNIVSMLHLPEAAGGGTPIAGSDSATLSEGTSGLERQSTVTDSASATDAAQLSRQSTVTDSLTVTDSAAVGQFFDKASSDSAAVTDSASVVSVTLVSGTDSASATEAAVVERQSSAADTATLTDSSALQSESQVSDTATLTDAAAIQRSTTAVDTASLTEAATVGELAVKSGSDTATATDAATVAVVSLVNSTDSGSVSESAVLQRSSDRTDSAELTEAASVSATLAALDFLSTTELALVSATVGAADAVVVTDAGSVFEPPSITVRPFTGTTARPSTGTTSRPNTGTTERP